MIAPEDREAGLGMVALLKIGQIGGAIPHPVVGGSGSLSAQLAKMGWKILPVPGLHQVEYDFSWRDGGTRPAFLDFGHTLEWLIVPPEQSGLRARKVEGKICAIRAACRMAAAEEG